MGILRKIILIDLPQSLEKALREQFPLEESQQSDIKIIAGNKIPPNEIFDLIVHKTNTIAAFPPAVPLLPLSLSRKERLGDILRQITQMTEEPSLWIDDFDLGEYVCKPSEKSLIRKNGTETALTDKETDILVYLARHNKTPVGREALLKNVWRYNEGVDTHTLETHIYRLRQKIEDKADEPKLLLTDEEGGYRLSIG